MRKKTFLGDDAPLEILTKLDEFCLNGTTQDFENCATSSIACYLSTKYLPLGCNVGFNENGELFEMYNFLEQNELLDPCTGKLLDKKKLLESSCVGAVPFSMSELDKALSPLTENLINCTEVNPCEKELIISYRSAALLIYSNSRHAERITIEKFGYNGWLDYSDAFRHALFNAMNAIAVGRHVAKLFSDAHECDQAGNPQSGNEVEMDLYNNAVGHNVGTQLSEAPIEAIIDNICIRLEAGQLKISTGANQEPLDPQAPLVKSFGCKCN